MHRYLRSSSVARAIKHLEIFHLSVNDRLTSPTRKVDNLRNPTTPHDTPNNVLVAVVHLLVLHVSRYKRVITGFEIDPLPAALADHGAPSLHGVYDGVLRAMVVYGRGRVGPREHAGCADARAFVDYGVGTDHALRLAA